jgi:dUTP pyrophosphatase
MSEQALAEFAAWQDTHPPTEYFRYPEIEMVVLPGGRPPERKSPEAIGYDVYARAIVSETEMDLENDRLRKTLFDFRNVPDSATLQEHIVPDSDDPDEWAYVLHPGDHALIGVGFATALPATMMYWLTPRSGLSMRRLTLTNAPGTIDPDYRGEAGALLVNQSDNDFLLRHHMRVAQAVFCPVYLPRLILRDSIDELSPTVRSGDGFGSTGMLG